MVKKFQRLFRRFEFPLSILWGIVYLNGLVWFAGLGGNDGWGYYANLESLIDDRDFIVGDNAHVWNEAGRPYGLSTQSAPAERLGGAATYYPWGHTLIYAVPFVVGGWVADVCDLSIEPSRIPQDSLYYDLEEKVIIRIIFLVMWTELLMVALVTFIYFICRRLGANPWLSFLVTFLAWWGSPLPFYANNVLSHAASMLFIASLFYVYTSNKGSSATYGVLTGFAAIIRSSNAILIFPTLLMAWRDKKIKGVLICLLTFSCVFSLNLVNWYLVTGDPLNPGYRFSPGDSWAHYSLWNISFDLRGGYFAWYPASLIAFIYLLLRAKKDQFYWPWLAMYLVIAVTISMRFEYHGAGGYGPRYLCPFVVALLPGFIELCRKKRAYPFIVLSLLWSTSLYLLYSAKIFSIDTLTNEPGRSIENFAVVFNYSFEQIISQIYHASHSLPLLVSRPIYLFAALIPIFVMLHIGFWWSQWRAVEKNQ